MGFSSNAGYVPLSIPALMAIVRENINIQFGLSYTEESFLGTNFYKYFYALIQRLQENEVKTSEIFLKLQEYFEITNEKILRPNTTAPGIIDYFKARDFEVSVKPPEDADAGKVFVCVNVDGDAPDYADTKLEICQILKDCIVGGVVSQGSEEEMITLSNNQSFSFKFNLPTLTPILLRLTITLSENNQFTIASPDDVKATLAANIAAKYRLGLNFEPQRYFSVVDAPWAAEVLLEWSDDNGDNWYDSVFDADYDDLFTFGLDDISIVED